MTSESKTYTCNICMEENTGEPEKVCCGIKYCFPCSHQTWGLCHVCDKDEILANPMACDMCGAEGTPFNISTCCAPEECKCEMWVCRECNKAGTCLDGSRPPFAYCSWLHFVMMLHDLEEWEKNWVYFHTLFVFCCIIILLYHSLIV